MPICSNSTVVSVAHWTEGFSDTHECLSQLVRASAIDALTPKRILVGKDEIHVSRIDELREKFGVLCELESQHLL